MCVFLSLVCDNEPAINYLFQFLLKIKLIIKFKYLKSLLVHIGRKAITFFDCFHSSNERKIMVICIDETWVLMRHSYSKRRRRSLAKSHSQRRRRWWRTLTKILLTFHYLNCIFIWSSRYYNKGTENSIYVLRNNYIKRGG